MFSLTRRLIVLLVCLVALGLYRGWFTVSNPSRDAENHKVNISVSVDADKFEADAEKVKQRIAQRVAQRNKQQEGTGQTQELK